MPMDISSLKEQCLLFVKEHFIALLVGSFGLIFLIYGFVSFYYTQHTDDEIHFSSMEEKPSAALRQKGLQEDTKRKIVIDVSGAVNKPGVYTLSSDSRVHDAIIEAGGLASTVDQQRVAQMLNLAAPLTDGAKLYIPVLGEQMVTSGNASGNSSTGSQAVAGESTQLININTASNTELESLPGIGDVTAGKIIENRPYGSVEELREKKVVGEATFEKIKEQISVY